MFTGKIENVLATEIFTILLPHGLQYTQYKNAVKLNPGNTGMILPVPLGTINYDLPINKCRQTNLTSSINSTSSEFSGLKTGQTGQAADEAIKQLFVAAENCFPVMQSMKSTQSMIYTDKAETLKVEKMGQFWVSVAMNIDDLSRFSREKFVIDEAPNGVFDVIKTRYAVGFSFLIFQLQGGGENHPFGYIHQTLPGGDCFIPTFHHHPRAHEHSISRLSSNTSSVREEKKTIGSTVEVVSDDWDHKIYSLIPRIPLIPPSVSLSTRGRQTAATNWKLEFLDAHTKLTTISPNFTVETSTGVSLCNVRVFHSFLAEWVGQTEFASDASALKSDWMIHKIEVKGIAPNGDIIISNTSQPTLPPPPTLCAAAVEPTRLPHSSSSQQSPRSQQSLDLITFGLSPTSSKKWASDFLARTEGKEHAHPHPQIHPSMLPSPMPLFEESIFSTPHYGIVCDGCQARNLRKVYKCMSCPDIDFCAACVSFNVHLTSQVGGHQPHHKLQLIGHPLDNIKHVTSSEERSRKSNSFLSRMSFDRITKHINEAAEYCPPPDSYRGSLFGFF